MMVPIEECEILVSRSGGAGGQNVNKVNTKITLRWNVLFSKAIKEEVRLRFLAKYKSKINEDGTITIISQEHRTQKLNLDEALKKLSAMIKEVLLPPKPRFKTKPTKSSKVKRLDGKKRDGNTKKLRSEKF